MVSIGGDALGTAAWMGELVKSESLLETLSGEMKYQGGEVD
jgi:hypothetical protein